MILSVTLNPCIDRTVILDGFCYAGMNRIVSEVSEAAGKGLNFARMLKNLGLDCLCTGFHFEQNRSALETCLGEQGIAQDFVPCAGGVRINTKIFNRADRTMTELNAPGCAVGEKEVRALFEKLEGLVRPGDTVVIAGSAPPGVRQDIYADLVELALRRGARPIVDAHGGLLRSALAAGPYLIKPNAQEFEDLMGFRPLDFVNAARGAKKLLESGIRYVCVSLGEKGGVLACKEGAFAARPPAMEVKGLQGAGDSMLAGICCAMAGDLDPSDMLRYGMAAAAAKVMRAGSQPGTRADFDRMLGLIEIEKVGLNDGDIGK